MGNNKHKMNTERYFIFFYKYTTIFALDGFGRIHFVSDEGFPDLNKVEQMVIDKNQTFHDVVIINFSELNEKDFRTSQGE